MLKVFYNVKNSTNYFQFKIPFQLLVNGVDKGKVLKISEERIIFNIAASKISNYNKQTLKKVLLQLTNTAIDFSINITNVSLSKKNESALIEAKIVWSNELDREVLGKCLYSVNWHRELFNNENNIFFRTFGYFIFNILNFKNSNKLEHWSPFVFALAKDGIKKTKCAFVSKININAGLARIAAFEKLDVGETILVYHTLNLEKNGNPLIFNILKYESYNSFDRKNLDKSTMNLYLVQMS